MLDCQFLPIIASNDASPFFSFLSQLATSETGRASSNDDLTRMHSSRMRTGHS